jgi:tetratricopeptide (TPR) repeat protein
MVKTTENRRSSGIFKSSSTLSVKADKVAVVEEKPTKPPGHPKFTRKPVHDGLKETVNDLGLDAQSASGICKQMLMDGFVQSYVDFYHLTHRHEDQLAAESSDNTIKKASTANTVSVPSSMNVVLIVPMSAEEMIFIRDNLVQAELARRQGDTTNVYTAYNRLADYYVHRKDWKTGFFFHEKCLEVAQLTSDVRAEMSANHALGAINQLMLNYDRARVHHEKHEQLALSVDIFEEVARANGELYKVYLVLAEKYELDGHLDEALEMYHRCDEAAKKAWDKAAEAEANGRIGNLMLNRGLVMECIPYLRNQSQLAADLGNPEARCRACSALALAFDLLGQPDKALTELQLVHTISEQSGDAYLQAHACRALGTLYSKVGRLDAAVDILQRHFTLLKSIIYRPAGQPQQQQQSGGQKDSADNDPTKKISNTDLDLARAYIGISRGNQSLGMYVFAINYDFTTLLDWKLNRSDLAKASQVPAIPTQPGWLNEEVNNNIGDASPISPTATNSPMRPYGDGEESLEARTNAAENMLAASASMDD